MIYGSFFVVVFSASDSLVIRPPLFTFLVIYSICQLISLPVFRGKDSFSGRNVSLINITHLFRNSMYDIIANRL